MIENLSNLTNLDGPSGYENEVREYIRNQLSKELDTKIDRIGNVIARNSKAKSPRVLVCAHMDEVGFIIQDINEEGFIRVSAIGGWDERILLGMPIKILGKEKIIGVFSTTPPHILKAEEANKTIKIDECFVDTGLTRKELNELGIDIGTFAVPFSHFRTYKDLIVSKALDDRIGCALLLEIAKIANELDYELIIGATVQEEVGSRGARVLANNTEPDLAIVLECTVAADIPGIETSRQPTALRKGVAITLMDKTMIADKRFYDKAIKIAKEEGIKYQVKRPSYGGTDAGAIHIAGRGIPSLVLSCPARYIHSANSMTTQQDLEETKKLLISILERIDKNFLE